MKDHVMKLRTEVLTDCQQYIKTKASLAVEANKLFWDNCPTKRKEYHPYNPSNLQVALSRVPRYVESMKFCAEKWIGYRFKFPLLWLPGDQYKGKFGLSNREEAAVWKQMRTVCGFRDKFDDTPSSYCLSNLHCSSQFSYSDSD